MNERTEAALASLPPEQQEAIWRSHAEYVEKRDRLERERREALEAMVASNPCCADHNRDGAIRARRWDFDWQLEPCPQHKSWPQISWLIHGAGRGQTVGDYDAA